MRMVHVDALSRRVAHVDELPLERQLELQQLIDPKVVELVKELKISNNDKFALIDGLVRKIKKD